MERQAGLGRSLEEVLESFTPNEPEPSQPERTLFEPEDLERQLDQLMGDIRDLRERVQHLVGMVPDGVVLAAEPAKPSKSKSKSKGKSKDKKNKKKQAETDGSVIRKTKDPNRPTS